MRHTIILQEESVDGVLTVLCNHSFHMSCLAQWGDTTWVVLCNQSFYMSCNQSFHMSCLAQWGDTTWVVLCNLSFYKSCNQSFYMSCNYAVTTVARKRSWSFCPKCRWQVTAKHAYILRMWLCMKWHGAWLYGVHRTCAKTAAVSCGTSHASAVSTPLRWRLKKTCYKKLFTHVKSHANAVSLLESGE